MKENTYKKSCISSFIDGLIRFFFNLLNLGSKFIFESEALKSYFSRIFSLEQINEFTPSLVDFD